MVPVARALLDADHEVRVAAPASFAPVVGRAGLTHVPFGDAPPEELGAVFAQLPSLSRIQANRLAVREVFGRIDTRAALPGVRAVVEEWRPDVILREPAELASYVVAVETGTRHLQAAIGLGSFEDFILPLLDEPLREHGCDTGADGLATVPRLTSVPERLDTPRRGDPSATHRFRGNEVNPRAPALPEWWGEDHEPLVYVSFGSVTAGMPRFRGLFADVVAALADVPARVLLTVGEAGDPEALEPLPRNVHVERWWPQRDVMPHASATVGHGGFGTTMEGLASGVPMVVMPLFSSDQFLNAARVQEIGAGIALDGHASVASLGSAVQSVLVDASYGLAVQEAAADIAALPPVSTCVAVIEEPR
jgi:glycosyltransferase